MHTSGQSNPTHISQSHQTPSSRSVPDVTVRAEQVNDQRHFSGRLVIREKGVELLLPPGQQELVLGRTDPAQNFYPDVDLAEQDGEKNGVSRRHARILQRPDGVYIEDLNSTNYTILNRIRLQPGQTYPLKDGDEIRLGVLTLEYRS
jgi:pSer/pThr/pTyr-binding forkhead associated (FHA) protein